MPSGSSVARPYKVGETPRFEREWAAIRSREKRADEALTGLRRVLSRIPDLGMAVPGHEGFSSYPVHLDSGTYLVVYTFDRTSVTLIAVRRAARNVFGDP